MVDNAMSLRERLLMYVRPSGKEGILPLFLDGKRIGSLTAKNLAFLSHHPTGRHFAKHGQKVNLICNNEAYNEFFAYLANSLHESILKRYWHNELLDICPYGESTPIAKAERALFRFLGMTTQSVYAIAKNNDNQWLLAKRNSKKSINPGKWDPIAAGLITSGESPFEAVSRELYEEAGLSKKQYVFPNCPVIQLLVERAVPEGWLREFISYFQIQLVKNAKLRNFDNEVECFSSMDTTQLLKNIHSERLSIESALGFLLLTQGSLPSNEKFGIIRDTVA